LPLSEDDRVYFKGFHRCLRLPPTYWVWHTFISGNISTSVDPSFTAKIYSRLVVMPKDLDAVYYLPVAKEALENRVRLRTTLESK
jgi:hypothetical protein